MKFEISKTPEKMTPHSEHIEKVLGCAECYPLTVTAPESGSGSVKKTDSFLRQDGKTFTEEFGTTSAASPRRDEKEFLPGEPEKETPFIYEKRK